MLVNNAKNLRLSFDTPYPFNRVPNHITECTIAVYIKKVRYMRHKGSKYFATYSECLRFIVILETEWMSSKR